MSFLTEHTNGCSPMKACANCQAVAILRAKLSAYDLDRFAKLLGEDVDTTPTGLIPAETKLQDIPQYEDMLDVRTRNCLRNENINTAGDLIAKNKRALLLMPNFGNKSLGQVEDFLTAIGHRLADRSLTV